jgi:hypothetical protein
MTRCRECRHPVPIPAISRTDASRRRLPPCTRSGDLVGGAFVTALATERQPSTRAPAAAAVVQSASRRWSSAEFWSSSDFGSGPARGVRDAWACAAIGASRRRSRSLLVAVGRQARRGSSRENGAGGAASPSAGELAQCGLVSGCVIGGGGQSAAPAATRVMLATALRLRSRSSVGTADRHGRGLWRGSTAVTPARSRE